MIGARRAYDQAMARCRGWKKYPRHGLFCLMAGIQDIATERVFKATLRIAIALSPRNRFSRNSASLKYCDANELRRSIILYDLSVEGDDNPTLPARDLQAIHVLSNLLSITNSEVYVVLCDDRENSGLMSLTSGSGNKRVFSFSELPNLSTSLILCLLIVLIGPAAIYASSGQDNESFLLTLVAGLGSIFLAMFVAKGFEDKISDRLGQQSVIAETAELNRIRRSISQMWRENPGATSDPTEVIEEADWMDLVHTWSIEVSSIRDQIASLRRVASTEALREELTRIDNKLEETWRRYSRSKPVLAANPDEE